MPTIEEMLFGSDDNNNNDDTNLLDGVVETPTETPKVTTNVLRPDDVEGTSLNDYIEAMRKGTAFLFSGKGYKVFKSLLREHDYKAAVSEQDGDAWVRAIWTADGKPDVQVEYRVPLYTNSAGYEVRGKRATINAW